MPSNPSQTVRHRRLSAELKRLREEAGVTVDRAAEALGSYRTKIHRIERGEWKRLKEADIRTLAHLYGVTDPAKQDALVAMAKQAKDKGWWVRYSDVLGPGTYISLEAEASAIRFYSGMLVPGLLQTPDYAKAVIVGSGTADEAVVERRLEARLMRQKILTQNDRPQIHTIVDEAALCRMVGGTETMRAQLHHLARLNEQGIAEIQVLTNTAGAHQAMTGQFIILDFESPDQSPVVFIDISLDGLLMEEPHDIERYKTKYDSLRQTALSPKDSNAYLVRLTARLDG
ncbi:helix-turn-helix transcriptional regulator [Nocardiopsis rhodophaea]|uniref:Helix-turn-helix transcriptional regulator n=1 Tax=Nocardiopsis rhodophaea TaxID=280238 RepID=A0ABP5EY18_9ACTN